MDSFGFSTKKSVLIFLIIPSPLQCGQLPFGELKEKVLGSG